MAVMLPDEHKPFNAQHANCLLKGASPPSAQISATKSPRQSRNYFLSTHGELHIKLIKSNYCEKWYSTKKEEQQ
jgi:hypothetical protein